LATRDEGLFGPDAKQNIVSPGDGIKLIHNAVALKAADQEVEEVLSVQARVAPNEGDSEN